MKGFDNEDYVIAYIISNVAAILLLWISWKKPRLGRLLFSLLFAWASWVNMRNAIYQPEIYLGNADLTFLKVYKDFILGFFSRNTSLIVGGIAVGQGLIALSMLLRGIIFKIGAVGAIIFFFSIAPLGMGSAFPCTLIMASGMYLLLKKENYQYLWVNSTPHQYDIA
ncbi:hypothetical protein WJR50_30030 [Catalinimonas sp. 4WD22]|uniref:hypothetical protein n=1 Tax=Catalinimonas locisalis TaxID=3133978 RepID=UPI0031013CF4